MPRHLQRARTLVLALLIGSAAVVASSASQASAGTSSASVVRASAGAPVAVPEPSPAAGQAHRVTLVTGDVVTVTPAVGGGSTVSMKPADVAQSGFRTQTVGKDLYVLPDAALPYLAAGRLDKELFDVTGLIAQHYDDASTRTLPLIVEYDRAVQHPAEVAAPTGARRTSVLGSIGAAGFATAKVHAASFWSSITARHADPTDLSSVRFGDGISKIYLDAEVHVDLADSVAQIGAPHAWSEGYDGTGTTVAVLDTGIDSSHPDLAGQVSQSQSFVPGENIDDYAGHGTHVASTIAGTGAASGGTEKGVAPGAKLVIGKVLGNDGYGQESWIIDGMEWAAPKAPVVSMSLGTSDPSDGTTPMDQAVNSLTDSTGTLFVIAAGNTGMPGGVSAPGAADDALTVGAVDGQDQFAYFSSMGPRAGDSALKPDLVAPGVDILAARSHFTDGTGDYVTMTGTSMATPHVAGAAAIVAEEHPTWSGQEIKDVLMSSAKGLAGYSPYMVGTGRVDVAAAVDDQVRATGSAYFGQLRWPNADAAPIDKTVTYWNDGDADVTLDLSATFQDANGADGPDGLLALSKDQVVVPAHGTASVVVTADPSTIPAGSLYAGTIVASDSGQPVARTDIGLEKEVEKYSLTLTATDRQGQPAQTWVTLHSFDDSILEPVFVDGQTTLRLPAGTYSAMTFMDVHDALDSDGVALLGSPQIDLTQDRTVDMDAGSAVPVTVHIPHRAEATAMRMEYFSSAGSGVDEALWMPFDVEHLYAAPTSQVTDGSFEFVTRWRLRKELFAVSSDTHHYDVTQGYGSAWLQGASRPRTAYLGSGTAADYAGVDVKGKAVVITRDASITDHDAAALAAQHHAAMLLVVNDAPEEFMDIAADDLGRSVTIPVGGVSGLEGPSLVALAQQGKRIDVSGGMRTPWVYDLQVPHLGRIPDHLSYTPKTSELTEITSKYYGNKVRVGSDFRFDFRPFSPYSSGYEQYNEFPEVRTEWVNDPAGTAWVKNATVLNGEWSMRGTRERFRPGQHRIERWYQPVIHPRLGDGYWRPVRQINYLQVNLPSFGDAGPGHSGGMDMTLTHQHIRIYRGTKLLASSKDWQAVGVDVGPKLATYRVTSDITRPKTWKTSTSSHSEYTFWSKYVANPGLTDPILPFVQVNFHVKTDLAGDARAGRRAAIGFDAWTMRDATLAGHLTGGRLAVSYDGGRTWHRVHLTGPTGSWTGHLRYPQDARKFVSLRASAWDSKGNRVTQVIHRAFGLR
jgi:subtilisin family serine protease